MTKANKITTDIRERETGIDILRMIAMLMIVIQHCLLHGALLNHGTDEHRIITDTIYTFCRIAVNVYAMITGYLCINSKFRLGRIMLLYAQVVFYTLGLFALVSSLQGVTPGEWKLAMFFPVSSGVYWYFTSYFCVALLIPFLNIGIKKMGKMRHRTLILVCALLFSVISVGGSLLNKNDPYHVGVGYSAIWLIYLYIIGAYIKLYPEDIKHKYVFLAVYLVCMIASAVLRRVCVEIYNNTGVSYTSYPVSYISPLMLVGTVCLVAYFSKVKLPRLNKLIKRFIAYVSTLTLGVYLIHDHPFVREYYIKNKFAELSKLTPGNMLSKLLLSALIIYVFCSCVDAVRKLLFKYTGLNKFINWLGDHILRITKRVMGGKNTALQKRSKR